MRRLALAGCILGAIVSLAPATRAQRRPDVEAALQAYLDARDAAEAESRIDAVIQSRPPLVTELQKRLRAGRVFPPQRPGPQTITITTSNKTVIETRIDVPEGYDPARAWPVRVQLHGGVSRPLEAGPRDLAENRIAGEKAIYLQPRAHAGAAWWHLNQFEHMTRLLDRVKRLFNVDDNQVYMTGISDGATGAYFYAMKLTTPFAAFLPLNGNMRVLATPGTRANGQMYAGNMINKPWFVVNGGRDPLYPLASVVPHLEMLQAAGADVTLRPQPEAGHDTRWWPEEREAFAAFVTSHRREPHPARVTWETERTDRYNRAHWVVVTALGRRPSDSADLKDVNEFIGPNGPARMFARTFPSGRIDAERSGNTFEVHTRGVVGFTLLLSTDVVDFSRPVMVRVNGEVVFEGAVTQDLRTLLAWHARDADRTMPYTAELPIRVP
ncbi:MAG: hypothetical protein IT178_04930 [Acidobacteria bacterium]|nr:hypothetical protein [Acidobacteriota bacterium]